MSGSDRGYRKTNRIWSDQELKDLPDLVNEHEGNWAAIAEAMGGVHTPSATRLRFNRGVREGAWAGFDIRTVRQAKHPIAKVLAKARPSATPAELWAAARRTTQRDLERQRTLRFADVEVDGESVIGIAAVSDQHLREAGPVDLGRAEVDARLIERTPGMFALLGGDGVDNHIKHRAAMVHGGSAPKREWELYDHYLSFFGSKVLAMITGNHDDWTSDFSGVSMVEQLAKQKRLHWAYDEMVLKLKLGSQEYHIKIRHQYRYNSSFNQVHTVKRLWEMGQDDFDVGIVCHHHEAAIEPFAKHGRTVWGARPGSYQLTSGHSRRYGYNHTTPTCPTFLFWPDRHKVLGFHDVADAAGYLVYLRSGHGHAA